MVDWETSDDEQAHPQATAAGRFTRVKAKLRTLIRYSGMALLLVGVWHFFAFFVGAPMWPLYADTVPQIPITVEQGRGVVDLGSVLVMVVGGAIVNWV